MKTIWLFLGTALVILLLACRERATKFKNTDLSFFNLKEKVKQFAEIKAIFDLDSSSSFDRYAKLDVHYYEHYFSPAGKLIKIENINPSPYTLNGFTIDIDRTENSLIITQESEKEIFKRTYSQQNNSLIFETYDKLDDNILDYHSENYKKQIFIKDGKTYKMAGYAEGLSPKEIHSKLEYAVIRNRSDDDSLVYLVGYNSNTDSTLIYSVSYLQYDKKHNWIKRQFHSRYRTNPSRFNSYSEYRKIVYYD